MMLNGVTMAYLGDSIYEYYVRKHLLDIGVRHVKKLHNEAIKYTSAKAQNKIIQQLVSDNFLSDKELLAYKLGRNSTARQTKKTCTVLEYKNATGYESLIASLEDSQERLQEVLKESFKIIETEEK